MVVTEGFSAGDLSGGVQEAHSGARSPTQPSDHVTGERSPHRGGAGSALPEAAGAVWLELTRNMSCSAQCKRQMK